MSTTPRLSIGLPVYNGGRYLPKALDSLLGQSYQDFEIIIADNASTDETSELCRDYESQDQRIRYFRQPRNIGSSPNHNFVVTVARGSLFKWASYDDLYGRELLERCVEALDERPEVVLAHSWTANIDESDAVFAAPVYALATDGATAPERFRSILFGTGGDDIYAVMRTSTLRRVLPQDSYHHAEHPIVAALSLHGPFHLVPDWLYFRRDHPQQAERACSTMRSRCANMDPRRADRLRHPVARLYAEYLWGYVTAIRGAPLTSAERQKCYRILMQWFVGRATSPRIPPRIDMAAAVPAQLNVEAVVAGSGPYRPSSLPTPLHHSTVEANSSTRLMGL
jgi:glycosyltransferase involved in cell wall biosynthesis